MNNIKKCVLLLSGGIDSVVLLHLLKKMNYNVYALSFNYKQKHRNELFRACYWANKLCDKWHVISIEDINQLISNSSLTGDIDLYSSPENTVVPNRNMIMLSIAIAWADNLGIGEVYFGANLSDYEVYPDCRQKYIVELSKASELGTKSSVKIKAPFIGMYKSDIVKLGHILGVDFSKTWTCYKGDEYHCGKCPSCLERIKAFNDAGIEDPIEYEN